MECSRVMQSLDTLWFFNNILITPSNVTELKAIPQKDLQDETPIKCPESGELAAEEIVKVDKTTMEEQEKEEEEEAVEMVYGPKGSESEKKEEEKRINGRKSSSSSGGKRRRRRRRRAREECMGRLFSERRMVLGEIFDMDYNDENGGRDYYSSWSNSNHVVEEREGYCGFRIGSEFRERMPPLSDDNAMKEHLKHWAHAVASTVTISVR